MVPPAFAPMAISEAMSVTTIVTVTMATAAVAAIMEFTVAPRLPHRPVSMTAADTVAAVLSRLTLGILSRLVFVDSKCGGDRYLPR